MAEQRRRASPVTWFPVRARNTTVASLASEAQATVLDEPLDHPTSGEDYGPGALVGVRLWMNLSAGAVVLGLPNMVLCILPAGLAVPDVSTVATLKQNEKYVWAVVPLQKSNVANSFEGFIHLTTVRRFETGDRLVIIGHNQGTVAYGAGAETNLLVDAYIRED